MCQSEKTPDPKNTSMASPHPGTIKKTGLTRIMRAGGYSLSGLRLAFVGEAAFRQECLLALIAFPVAYLLPIGVTERIILIGATCLVLIVELLNSAVEAVDC